MTSPDSWVRSAYSVFWSRPGASSHDYQPLGAQRRPRPRRLRGWQPLAAVLVLTVLGLSTLGLVLQRPETPLDTRKGSASVRMALSKERAKGETAPEGVQVEVTGEGKSEGEVKAVDVEQEEQDQSRQQNLDSGSSALQQPQQTAEGPPHPQQQQQPLKEQQQQQQGQEQQPKETLVILEPVNTKNADIDSSGNGVPVVGD